MTTSVVTDEQLGQLARRQHELFRRVKEGTLPAERALNDLQLLIEGRSFVLQVIDCDATPFAPNGWSVAEPEHQVPGRVTGKFACHPSRVALHLDPDQRGDLIVGVELFRRFAGKPVLPAQVLDYLLAHPELIPEKWKGKFVFFWGTVYRGPGGNLCVRCLYWRGERWSWRGGWLDSRWHSDSPAAVSAS